MLLPCPFCGAEPRLFSSVVSCENNECPASPRVLAQTGPEASRLWNRHRKRQIERGLAFPFQDTLSDLERAMQELERFDDRDNALHLLHQLRELLEAQIDETGC